MATTTEQAPTDDDRITEIGERAGLSDAIINFAKTLYHQARDQDFALAGDGRVYPAALYAATRVRGEPVKPRTIADAAGVPTDDVVSDFERLVDTLPFDVDLEDPIAYVRDYLDDLDAPADMRNEAVELASDAKEAGLDSGKSASGFAAGVVYAASLISDAGYSQDDVKDAANVGIVTVRNRYKDVMDVRDVPMPNSGPSSPNTAGTLRDAIEDVYTADELAGIPSLVKDKADEIADDVADEAWVEGKTPRGVAAGILWYVADNNRVDLSQADAADAAGVHKETVHNRVKDLRKWERRKELDDVNYNRLKEIAGDHDVDVGQQPKKAYLIDRIIEEEAFDGE